MQPQPQPHGHGAQKMQLQQRHSYHPNALQDDDADAAYNVPDLPNSAPAQVMNVNAFVPPDLQRTFSPMEVPASIYDPMSPSHGPPPVRVFNNNHNNQPMYSSSPPPPNNLRAADMPYSGASSAPPPSIATLQELQQQFPPPESTPPATPEMEQRMRQQQQQQQMHKFPVQPSKKKKKKKKKHEPEMPDLEQRVKFQNAQSAPQDSHRIEQYMHGQIGGGDAIPAGGADQAVKAPPMMNNLSPDSPVYGGLSAPKFRNKRAAKKKDDDESDSDDYKISPWDARRSSVNAGHLQTTSKEDIMQSRRKSIFDESSSDEEEEQQQSDNPYAGRRLTVDIHGAKNDAVSAIMPNLNKYQ